MSDTTAVNQACFKRRGRLGQRTAIRHSKLAAEYDSRYQKTLGRLEEEVRARADFVGVKKGGRPLDYACGTGLLSRVRQTEPRFVSLWFADCGLGTGR
ncbi:Putative methyltransferase [Tolypocladium paradoxum]|uniref:Methyltransferase n=1 Tax=Tolypocladium paradoxum TaxID=94208 RepID=A0A2S4KY26_9HYPO|nr:Putative methyltransferase [Tolypocladium paradoxum]